MTHSTNRQIRQFLTVLMLTLVLSACKSTIDGNWKITRFVTKEKKDDAHTEIIFARNCSFPENKDSSCGMESATEFSVVLVSELKTSEALSTAVGVSAGVSLKSEFKTSAAKTTEERMAFPAPPSRGKVYRYTLVRTFTTYSGDALIKSPNGEERFVNYTYRATCSQRIEKVETLTCKEAEGVSTEDSSKVPAPELRKAILGKWRLILSMGMSPAWEVTWDFTGDGRIIRTRAVDGEYVFVDDEHIEVKDIGITVKLRVNISGDGLRLTHENGAEFVLVRFDEK